MSIIDCLLNLRTKLDVSQLLSNEFGPRPLVVVEDRVYHISELLGTIQRSASHLLPNLTVVCLDRIGPDTDAAVSDWQKDYPTLQIASRIEDLSLLEISPQKIFRLPDDVFVNQNDYCRTIAGLIRKPRLAGARY